MQKWERVWPGALATLLLLLLALLLPGSTALGEQAVFEAGLKPLPLDLSPGHAPSQAGYLPDNAGYVDGSIQVRITKDRAYDTDILRAHILIKDASQLRTAPSNTFQRKGNQLAATVAKRYNAVLAINGDYFQFTENRYIVRQGELVRNRPTGEDLLFIDSAGDFHAALRAQKQDIQSLTDSIQAQGRSVVNCFSFGPMLVMDNQQLFSGEERYFSTSPHKYTQRVVLAQLGELEYLIVSTEGPEDKGSRGLKLGEVAAYTLKAAADHGKPCLYAYNLDGGSSNSLILNDEKINSPANPKSRAVSDIIYFATLIP